MGFSGGSAALFLIAAVVAAVAAAVACCCGPIDVPNGRSNHVRPRPRGAGISLLLGAGAGAIAVAAGIVPAVETALGADAARLAAILAVAGAGGLIGLLDDLSLIGLRMKFAAIALVALAAALAAGPVQLFEAGEIDLLLPYAAALLGSALWIFVAVNAVNFMDGADGMMASSMGVAGLALALLGAVSGAPVASVCGALLAGSLAGFLPFNAPHARAFAGDVGAIFAGVLFGAGALDLATHGAPGAVWIAPLLIAPFLADVFSTLIARARRGESLVQGHREHAYQLLTAGGWPHASVAALYAALAAACAIAGAVALAYGSGAALAALGGIAAIGLTAALALRAPLAARADADA